MVSVHEYQVIIAYIVGLKAKLYFKRKINPMKRFYTYFLACFMIVCLLPGLGNAQIIRQSNESAPTLNSSENIPVHPAQQFRSWNVQFNLPLDDNHSAQAGLETDGSFFYVTQWNEDSIFKYDLSGNYIEAFVISGVGHLRDLAYDGQYFYGSDASATIYEMDFTNQLLVSSISCPSGTAVRHIAYDANQDAFWVGNWSTDILLIDRSGTQIDVIPSATHGLSSIYGTAYDTISAGGPFLWAIDANSSSGMASLFQLDLSTGQQTGIAYNVLPDLQVDGIGGGLFIAPDIIPGTYTLGGLIQNVAIFGYDLEHIIDSLDAGVINVVGPESGDGMSTLEQVHVIVKNFGSQTLNNLPIAYVLNNGDTITENLTTSLAFGEEADFLFSTGADLSAVGEYVVDAFTLLDGDANADNDLATRRVYSLSNSSEKLVLVEHFTQASCAPCAAQNPALDALITSAGNIDRVVHIAYHTSWPGVDPMYDFNVANSMGDARVDYYNVTGVPDCVLAGNQGQGLPSIITQDLIDGEYSRPGMFNITGTAQNPSGDLEIILNIESYCNFNSGDIVAHVVLAEEVNYASAPGSNGEIYFPDVMRYMFPDPDGTNLNNPTDGQVINLQFTYAFQSPVDIHETHLVVFIQDNTTKDILMATRIPVTNLIQVDEELSAMIQVYPNPSAGILKINHAKGSSMSLFDMSGKLVWQKNIEAEYQVLDLSSLSAGPYHLQFQKENEMFQRNIIIKH